MGSLKEEEEEVVVDEEEEEEKEEVKKLNVKENENDEHHIRTKLKKMR